MLISCTRQVWDLSVALDRPVKVHRTASWADRVRLSCAAFAPVGPALVLGYSNGRVGVFQLSGLGSAGPPQEQRDALAKLLGSAV